MILLLIFVVSCWVRGCTNRADEKGKRGFFSIPTIREHEGDFTKELSEESRRSWLAKINRKDDPTKYSKICSEHFLTGKPASMYDKANPDWVPTLKLGEDLTPTKSVKKEQQSERSVKRFNRAVERQRTKEKHDVARALIELHDNTDQDSDEFLYLATPIPDEMPQKSCVFTLNGPVEKLDQPTKQVKPVTDGQ